jgi:carbamoyltransferase
MYILGISCYYHDSAACLILDDVILSAMQEERFTRKKHDSSFPVNAIKACLDTEGIGPSDIDIVVYYDKPFLKFERLIETYIAFAPNGLKQFVNSFGGVITDRLFQSDCLISDFKNNICDKIDWRSRLRYSYHHLSHAASAYYPSGFDEAVVIVMDGVGEWASTSIYVGSNGILELKQEIKFPHSLGLLYSSFTYFCGFKVNSGEYKLMGLAPYGKPIYYQTIMHELVSQFDDGSYALNMNYFEFCTSLKMVGAKFEKLFGIPVRSAEAPLTKEYMDLAASVQKVLEEIVLGIVKFSKRFSESENLCLSGGVALNCVSNGNILRSKLFKNIYIQPASGDAGGALGCALAFYYATVAPNNYNKNRINDYYLGLDFDNEQVLNSISGINYSCKEYDYGSLYKIVAAHIRDGLSVGWFQGRAEFGPRALGNRSILANPLINDMQRKLNLQVKFRESFRPFAPSVLLEDYSEWFQLDVESPHMLLVAEVNDAIKYELYDDMSSLDINSIRSKIPSVTHVDYTARIQTVDSQVNEKYYNLISEFKKLTGCPILINTSFNIRGEPIVNTPLEAYKCFMGTGLDVLVINNFIFIKADQPVEYLTDYKDEFELD